MRQSRFRILPVLDVYTRECLALVAGQRFREADVANILKRLVEERERVGYIHYSSLSYLSPWDYANNYQEKREVTNSLNTLEISV